MRFLSGVLKGSLIGLRIQSASATSPFISLVNFRPKRLGGERTLTPPRPANLLPLTHFPYKNPDEPKPTRDNGHECIEQKAHASVGLATVVDIVSIHYFLLLDEKK